jgi:hypothetical protein
MLNQWIYVLGKVSISCQASESDHAFAGLNYCH